MICVKFSINKVILYSIILLVMIIFSGIAKAIDENGTEKSYLPDSVLVYDNAGTWAIWNSTTNSADIVGCGWNGTMPIVRDWDADGTTETDL